MKITNYSNIAEKYEENKYRLEEVKFDDDLQAYIYRTPESKYQVLDLACGTGIYLDQQINRFKQYPIDWHGLDASKEMLEKSKAKLENVSFVHAHVESMPYQNNLFNYISNNYAFHHFKDKDLALNEINRVLKNNGVYKLHNIAMHEMQKWWLYQYFPTAYYEDLKRFWEKEVIFNELSLRGFDVNMKIEYRIENIKLADYIAHAENRDISVLTLIDDQDYLEGLEKMRYDIQLNPDKTILNEFAKMNCVAIKS